MRFNLSTTLTLGAFALTTLGAGAASAQSGYLGNEVMLRIVKRLQDPAEFNIDDPVNGFVEKSCGDILGTYFQIGATQTEFAMCRRTQRTGLMDRPLVSQIYCSENCSGADGNAVQARLAANAITVMRNNGGQDRSCDSIVSGTDWKTTLRTLFSGADGSGSSEACSAPERLALLNNWSSIWSNGCTQDPSPCTQVHHLYRPDENSGMGQVFAFLVGIDNYCNGGNQDDNDPVRRPCREDERYCPNGQDLGVVLPVKFPFGPQARQNPNYFAGINNTKPCGLGNFEYALADSTSQTTCPDTTQPFAGFLCVYPRDAQNRFGCNNDALNGSPLFPFADGRAYNEIPLQADGTEVPVDGNVTDYREYYRMKANCLDGGDDSSETLGCIVAQSQCSIGWGSMIIRKELTNNPALATAQLGDAVVGDRTYPLNQFLYLNTIDGFATATGEEAKLVNCINNHPERIAAAVQDAGYAPFPTVAQRPVPCDGPPPTGDSN